MIPLGSDVVCVSERRGREGEQICHDVALPPSLPHLFYFHFLLAFLFPFLLLFFLLSANLWVQMKQQKVREWSN